MPIVGDETGSLVASTGLDSACRSLLGGRRGMKGNDTDVERELESLASTRCTRMTWRGVITTFRIPSDLP